MELYLVLPFFLLVVMAILTGAILLIYQLLYRNNIMVVRLNKDAVAFINELQRDIYEGGEDVFTNN
jgi:lipid-A-disaccharide synthase-like uncharacterized protein